MTKQGGEAFLMDDHDLYYELTELDWYFIWLIHSDRFGNAKQHILPGLTKNGVRFDVRPLSVGDFVWIAKEKYGMW